MALKGKKKSRSRGSQARRRPGAAPRPALGAVRRPPWYRTTGGRIAAGVAALVVIGLIVWAVNNSGNEEERLADRQRTLNEYTSDVRGLLQTLIPPASEIGTAASIPPEGLAARAKEWDKQFSAAQGQMSRTVAPRGLEAVNRLVLQSILLYVSAGDTYELSAQLEEGPDRQSAQTQANVQWTSANSVFDAAVALLDEQRDEAKLSGSGLQSPGTAPPTGPTGESSGTEIETGGDGSDGGSKDGGKRDGRRSRKGGKNRGDKGNG